MRGLATGNKDHKKIAKLMKERFVFLNVYCTSVADEHKPRGPKGPYQFNDKSVPVCVIKRWDGETYHQQLGFGSDPKQNLKTVANWIEKAVKKNGPVQAPKKLRPLVKSFDKGANYLTKKRPGYAYKEFAKVYKLGSDQKKFPEGIPRVASKAKAEMDAITTELDKHIAAALKLKETDEAKAKAAFSKLQRSHGNARVLKQKIIAAQKK